jgi:undecaprenyl-diphosphatase
MKRFSIFQPEQRPRPHPPAIGAFLLLLVLLVALSVAAYRAGPLLFDLPLERDVQSVHWSVASRLFDFTNWLGEPIDASVAVVLVAIVMGAFRRVYDAVLSVSAIGANAIESIMKQIVDRPRPPASLVHVTAAEHGFSFPSGHATFFAAWILMLYLVVGRRLSPSLRLALAILAALLILAAGLARVEVGVHWPTDVIGGYVLAAAWVLLISPLLPPLRRSTTERPAR